VKEKENPLHDNDKEGRKLLFAIFLCSQKANRVRKNNKSEKIPLKSPFSKNKEKE
jgi:hypothetical protein